MELKLSDHKLSHSAITMYTQCAKKYKLHYMDRLRPETTSGALIFGSAYDDAVNELLVSKDLVKAKTVFLEKFKNGNINGKKVYLPTSELVVYSSKDFDWEIITESDQQAYDFYKTEIGLTPDGNPMEREIDWLNEQKEEKGFDALEPLEKSLLAYGSWLCLKNKGYLMLESFEKNILPKIKKVLAVQKEKTLVNEHGDKIKLIIDLIVKWEDDRIIVFDNKTSAMAYKPDSASKSQQLVLYKIACEDEYDIDGVGFIVMYKNMKKERIRSCSKCGYETDSGRVKKCKGVDENGKRCNNELENKKLKIKALCKVIINEVKECVENLVLEVFEEANEGIKGGHFGPNMGACMAYNQPCPYYNLCYHGSKKGLVDRNKKE